MKGYNNDRINFIELKEKFYNNGKIGIENFLYLRRSNFSLENITTEKIFDLNKYDKRKFVKNKKETQSLFYKDFLYH